MKAAFAVAHALLLMCVSLIASADDTSPSPEGPNPEVMRLIAEGKSALADGRTKEACALFESAAQVEATSEALLASGQCHELLGKTATAWKELTRASVIAEKEGAIERADRARSLAGKLAPRLSKIRIDVISRVPEQSVLLRGAVVPETDWGVLLPVDPGDLTVVSRAPGYSEFTETVKLGAEGDVRVIVVKLIKPGGDDTKKPDPQPEPDPTPKDGVTRIIDPVTVAGFVATSFGALGMVLGITFGVATLSDVAQAEEDPLLCPNKLCSPAGRALIDEASTKSTISTVSFAVGGAALGAGVIILVYQALTKPVSPEPQPATAVSVRPAAIGSAIGVEISF